MLPTRFCSRLALIALLAAAVLPATAQAGTTAPKAVSPANNASIPFADAVVFAMAPEPGHTCSEYYLALDSHADENYLGPQFQHPACTVVVALGSELRADAEHSWRVWRSCSGNACNGPGETSQRSAKKRFHLDGPIVTTNPQDGATLQDLAFPVQLSMNPSIAAAPFEIRISSSPTRDALGRLSEAVRTVPTALSPTVPGSHLALLSGLEPGLFYWQWVRLSSACASSAIDCPGPVLRLQLDPSGTLPELDVTPPSVRPLKGKGRVGKRMKLRYTVLEDQGQGRVTVWVYRKTKARKRWRVWLDRVQPRKTFHVVWTPRKPGVYRLCTRAQDGSKNTSKKRCARIKVTPRPTKRSA